MLLSMFNQNMLYLIFGVFGKWKVCHAKCHVGKKKEIHFQIGHN